MVWDSPNLQTRQFERRSAELPARIEILAEHADQIRLAFADALARITVTDLSEGGIGLSSGLFLPKNARVLVRVRMGETPTDKELTVQAIVRRCIMMDVRPTYHIGLQFLELTPEEKQSLLDVLAKRAAPTATGTRGLAARGTGRAG
ncbi:MAG: PilZ domain-containing protein [Phycisphaerae bacterium]